MALSQLDRKELQRQAHNALGISQGEERRYSLARALLTGGLDGKVTGYEGEVDQQLRILTGKTGTTNGSFMVPTGLPIAARDMTVGTDSAGGYLVSTDILPGSFVDLLRTPMVAYKAGVSILTGLKGDVTIPRQTAGASAYWLANEATAITESNQTLGQVPLTPKTVGAYTEFSRQLLMQSTPSVDQIIANDLAKVVAAAVDAAVFNGSGSSGEPYGVRYTSGIGDFDGSSMTLAKLLAAQTDIANALDSQGVAYITTPAQAALLMQRFKNATYGSDPLWEGNILQGSINGVKAFSSAQVPTGYCFLGDWSSVVIGEWGYLEIATNPFANFTAGIIGCRAMQSVDIGLRLPGAFTMSTNCS